MSRPSNSSEVVDPYATPSAKVDPGREVPGAGALASNAEYRRGYNDCLQSHQGDSMSMSASGYAPGDVDRESYEAGWQAASAIEGVRLARRERRGDILVSFISGGLLLGVGILALVLSATSGGRFVVVSFGAIFTGGGLIMRGFAIASGKDVSDAADGGA